jgi:Protein of unknown function (DUF3224)
VPRATGPFEVKVTPLAAPAAETAEGVQLSRFALEKQLRGDLEATGKGEMLAAGTGAKGSSGGYVALEKLNGTLARRKGTFVLQHNSIMTRGVPQMNIFVVPDSGTGELTGLTGKFTIVVAEGKHAYEFDYSFE